MPNVAPNTPLGTVIAQLNASWDAGPPFNGNFTFVPGSNPGGVYAIIQAEPGGVGYLVVNPSGPGVGAGGTITDVSIVANDPAA